ncbi:MAG: GNAT family N-acetyltransferase [Planctomycetales bacterium]|nr:GNAT family N-acetyltransferase [Planctomycetales bacterium]
MIHVREAKIEDVHAISEIFRTSYGEDYAYPLFYDKNWLTRLVFADDTVLLVAEDTQNEQVLGTASVVSGIGGYNDLVGEFGRLAVHPDARGRGIGSLLMEGRLERVKDRLHLGLVENRVAHEFSQRISAKFDFVPIGFVPQKLPVHRREPVACFARYFGDALQLRRNNPRVIPEACELASIVLHNCGLPNDPVIDDSSAPFPYETSFELEELTTEGYTSLLRIQRGRVRGRDIFGPVRLHYGMFQLKAKHSHYYIARRAGHIAGGIGFMVDPTERNVRIFELISINDEPIRLLLSHLLDQCRTHFGAEFVEVDVSAYAPRMQRTLLELGFLPVSYIPASVFHEVERLDAIKMVTLLIPFEMKQLHISAMLRPIADHVIRNFMSLEELPLITSTAEHARLFQGLNAEQRRRLVNICEPRSFAAGDEIFACGEQYTEMHLVLSGEASLWSCDGAQVGEVQSGQCLGEATLLEQGRALPVHSLRAQAEGPVETVLFDRDAVVSLIRRRPDIGVVIYRNLAADVSAKLRARTTAAEIPPTDFPV